MVTVTIENEEPLLHPLVIEAVHKYGLNGRAMACDPALADTAAFCEHYKFDPDNTCNTILAASKTDPVKFACCVILASCKLDLNKTVCQRLGVKKGSFASGEQTIELTGMQIGGVTAVGVHNMPIYVDEKVFDKELILLGGGNRSSKLLLHPDELRKLPELEIVPSLGILR